MSNANLKRNQKEYLQELFDAWKVGKTVTDVSEMCDDIDSYFDIKVKI